MAVRTYSDLDHDDLVRDDTGYAETTAGGVAGMVVLWIGWAMAAAIWAFGLTAFFGILQAVNNPALARGEAQADAGGVSWMLINVIGGLVVLGLAIAWGSWRWATRDKGKDAMTEAATHAEYDLIEAHGGDDEITRSPEAHKPEERDAYKAALKRPIS